MQTDTVVAAPSASVLSKFQALAAGLKAQFIERDHIIDAMVACLACGQHILLLGEPGTGKSALANAMTKSIDGATLFSWLLSKASPPEEVLGPLSLSELKNDRFIRCTAGKLPEADIAFLDEIFKCNSTLLNATLGILNERTFYNGPVPTKVPLQMCVGASNEYPTDVELAALWDRFLVRFWVDRISDGDKLIKMLTMKDPTGVVGCLTKTDIETARAEVAKVRLGQAGLESIRDAKVAAEGAGFFASDRRWRQTSRYLRAVAWMNGDSEVNQDHLLVLADILWREHKERPKVLSAVGKVANPSLVMAIELSDAVKALLGDSSRKKDEPDNEFIARVGKISVEAKKASSRLGELMAANPSSAQIGKLARESQKTVQDITRGALRASGFDLGPSA